MARGRNREIPPCSKTYGFPIYCAGWAPLDRISAGAEAVEAAPERKEVKENEEEGGDGGPAVEEQERVDENEQGGEGDPSPCQSQRVDSDRFLVAVGGGGGGGRSGVPNVLVVAEFDFPSRSLSDQPVFRLETGADVPYRMAMHPGGDGIICSFFKSCRWFEWGFPESRKSSKLVLKSSERILTPLEDVGLQLALAFNGDGSILATGGEDGHLRVFKWPSMENILDQKDAHSTVKDLEFSSDSRFLVSLGSSGPCRVWDLTSSTTVANLPRENGEIFGFCRFSETVADKQIFFVTAMHGNQAEIISWSTLTWKRIGSKKVARDPISAFSVSTDGKHIAVGTVEGNVSVLSSSDLSIQMTVQKAHLGIVTALVFSRDSRALVSTSFDSYARVTVIEGQKNGGSNMWLFVMAIILVILAYYIQMKGIF